MKKIRVLVVDDSVVIRRILTDMLNEDEQIEVVGIAQNGQIALNKLTQLNPDLVTLDIEMPVLDGLATLVELRKDFPKLPVIMFSTLCETGAKATLDALTRGATDYVGKPANVESVAAGIEAVRSELVPKIKSLFTDLPFDLSQVNHSQHANSCGSHAAESRHIVEIVVIGASTGGPQALTTVLAHLPACFPVPIVIVQHMPPVFTKYFADRLNEMCPLAVTEVSGEEPLEPGNVYIAPGGHHLELHKLGSQVKCVLSKTPPENSCRPAVDVLFRTASQVYGPRCLGVVLTGMGRDGYRGSEHIVHEGGSVIAQDAATSVVWGMPRAIVEAHLTKTVLPIYAIAGEILLRCR